MNDWDENPDNYLKDDNGDFILKQDGTPKRNPEGLKAQKVVVITTTLKLKQK